MDLIKIWNETEREMVYYKSPPPSIKYSKLFNANKKIQPENFIRVTNLDSIDAGKYLLKLNLKPVVLNMCDWDRPGGDVIAGARTQEEEIFRRSNYYITLNESFYPLKEIDTIYSSDVTIFKESIDKYYNKIQPFNLDFIAAPAINNPKLVNGQLNESDKILMYNKIKMLFEIALHHKHDSIVLSAWGCGAYRCPPKEISDIFKKVISEYKKYFICIIFAIKGKGENETIFKHLENGYSS